MSLFQKHLFPLPHTGQMPRQLFCYVNFDQLPTISVTKTVTGVDALIRALQRASNKQIPVKESPDEKKKQFAWSISSAILLGFMDIFLFLQCVLANVPAIIMSSYMYVLALSFLSALLSGVLKHVIKINCSFNADCHTILISLEFSRFCL